MEIARAGQEAPARASDEQLLPLRWCTSFCWPCCHVWPWVKQKTDFYSLPHSSPNHNPQKLEIPHIYLFGGYGNPCATQKRSANDQVHRVRFQGLWADYGLERFTDYSDWTLFSHWQLYGLVLQARALWWALFATSTMVSGGIPTIVCSHIMIGLWPNSILQWFNRYVWWLYR